MSRVRVNAHHLTLQRVGDLGFSAGEKTPWASTVGTCRKNPAVVPTLGTFLEGSGVEPTTNAGERALRQAVIHRKLSYSVHSAPVASASPAS